MPAYRFCRTDDIGLLVDALNRCWAPYFPNEPPMTPAAFKRSIRDLQVWCSSCMVAFSGSDPIGVLIGAKRSGGTLVQKIAVHPDHRRQGHARHLLASLGSKLAILGPPRLVAEVDQSLMPACALFDASGYVQEAVLPGYVWDGEVGDMVKTPGQGGWVIPVTVDDLAANGLLEAGRQPVCWERSVESITARKDGIEGLAVASDERIEACILYIRDRVGPEESEQAASPESACAAEIVALRSFVEDDGTRLKQLLFRLPSRGIRTLRFRKVHSEEIPKVCLEALGFRRAGSHLLYSAPARAE